MSKRKNKVLNGLDKGFAMKEVNPKTEAQRDVFDAYKEGYNLLLHGMAGTGKTFISLTLGLQDVWEGNYQRIIIIRSVVPSRDMGFLPGSIEEKSKIYEAPYTAIVNSLFQRGDAYNALRTKGAIEFMTTSFERGMTLENSVVIVDEIQNMTFQELDTTITRIGEGCRLILSGDIAQTDLTKKDDKSGLPTFIKIIEEMESFDMIEFTVDDVVRSGLVKEYLLKKHDLGLDSKTTK